MKRKSCIKVLVVYIGFVSLAFNYGLLGPTLPELQRIAHVDTDVISWLATSRAIGQLAGSPLAGIGVEYLPRGWVSSITLLISGPCMCITPFFNNVILMGVSCALWGVASAFVIVGLNVEIIRLDTTNNEQILQGLHFMFNLGLLLAPISVTPFLSDQSNQQTTKMYSKNNHTQSTSEDDGLSDIVIPYIIGAAIVLISSSLYFCTLCPKNSEERPKARRNNTEMVDLTAQKNRILVFVLSLLLFMFCCMFETNYTTFLATFAVNYLKWGDKTAATLTSVFLLAFAISRFLGIFTIKLLGSTKLIWFSLVMTLLGILPLYFLKYSSMIIWISSGIIGLAFGPVYATNLTWANENVYLSGKLASIIILTGSVGYSLGPFLQGQLFTFIGIESFIYLCTGAVACALSMTLILTIYVKFKPVNVHVFVREIASNQQQDEETTPILPH